MKIYLKLPSLQDKSKMLDYIEEFRNFDEDYVPMDFEKDMIYEEWLQKIEDLRTGKNLHDKKVPMTYYFIMDDDKIVGHIKIRHNIQTDFLSKIGGHIGCGVRPSERKKGYATKGLELALIECKKMGIDDVMVSCKKENVGSAKCIQNNGGVFEGEVDCRGDIYLKYNIKTNQNCLSLKKEKKNEKN